jgi:hypothetical protein
MGSKARVREVREAQAGFAATVGERQLAWTTKEAEWRRTPDNRVKAERQKRPSGGSQYARKHPKRGRQ